jgi:phosphoribosylglycinamide formyltransferase-1
MAEKPAFAVFASGNGSNLQRFIDETHAGCFPAMLALVVSDRPECYAVTRAQQAHIPTLALAPKSYPDKAAYEQVILRELQARQVRWVDPAAVVLHLDEHLRARQARAQAVSTRTR